MSKAMGRTSLIVAAKAGNVDAVAALLARGDIDINEKDYDGRTALSHAAENGHNAVVELLLATGAGNIHVNECDFDGHTALSHAAGNGYTVVVKLLLAAGAGNEIKYGYYDYTALLHAAGNGYTAVVEQLFTAANGININLRAYDCRTALSIAAKEGYVAVVERLLATSANDIDVNKRDCGDHTAPLLAVERGYIAVVERLLAAGASNVDVNERDTFGRTALVLAAESGHTAVVERLLAAGANPNLQDLEHLTPLWHAARYGHTAVVKLLLKNGVSDLNPWSKYAFGHKFETPLAVALKKGHRETAELLAHDDDIDALHITGNDHSPSVLGLAINAGYQSVALSLLAKCRGKLERDHAPKRGKRIDTVESASRLLVYALSAKCPKVALKLLMRHGANINAVCRCGPSHEEDLSPLMAASKRGDVDSVSFLLKTLAGVDPNISNALGCTALILASAGGFVDVVKMLVSDERVAVDQRDKEGRTALSHAAEHAYEDVVAVLLDTGRVDSNSRDQNGYTPLTYAVKLNEEDAVDVVRLLLNFPGININATNNDGNTVLMDSAACGYAQMVELLLTVATNIDPNMQNQKGMSALHQVAELQVSINKWKLDSEEEEEDSVEEANDEEYEEDEEDGMAKVTRALIATSDIDVNLKDSMGRTALSYAAEGGNPRLVEILLEAVDIDPDLRDTVGRSPLSWALPDIESGDDQALTQGRTEVVRLLLSNPKVDPNAEDAEGLTPLIRAIQGPHSVEFVELMLEHLGLDVNQQGRSGLSPLSVAEKIGNTIVIELLRRRGATASDRPVLDANSQPYVEDSASHTVVRLPIGDRLPLGTQQEYINEWVDGTENLCEMCSKIDLDAAFSSHHTEYDGRVISDLGRVDDTWETRPCPLCRLFAAVRPPAGSWHDEGCSLLSFSSTHSWICGNTDRPPFKTMEDPLIDTMVLAVVEGYDRNYLDRVLSGGLICRLGSNCPEKKDAITIPRLLGTNGESAARMSAAREWISFCRQNHSQHCNPRDKSTISPHLSLIDCKSRRVIKQHGFEGAWPPPYAALSYVWGLSRPDEPHSNDLGGAVEAVIEDAIRVTLDLGYSYLWIDRYCVVQEGNDALKDEQMRHMHLVYINAEVTLVAAAGKDASAGLPGAPKRPRSYQQLEALIKGHKLVCIPPDPDYVVSKSTWATRGWTYQEGLLARRRLYFTEKEMSFGCRHMLCRETMQLPPGQERKLDGRKPREGETGWMHEAWRVAEKAVTHGASGFNQLLSKYTARKLTYPEDALKAILGVLQRLADHKKWPLYHVCGIPISKLSIGEEDEEDEEEREHNEYLRVSGVSSEYEEEMEDMEEEEDTEDEEDGNDFALAGFVNGLRWELSRPARQREGFPTWSWAGWNEAVSGAGGLWIYGKFRTSVKLSIVPRDKNGSVGAALSWDHYYGLRLKTDDVSKAIWSGQNHMLEITAVAVTVRFHIPRFGVQDYIMACAGDHVWRGFFLPTWNGKSNKSDAINENDNDTSESEYEDDITDSLRTALLQKPWEGIVLGSLTPSSSLYFSPYTYVLVVQEQQQQKQQQKQQLPQTCWERIGLLELQYCELKDVRCEQKTWLVA